MVLFPGEGSHWVENLIIRVRKACKVAILVLELVPSWCCNVKDTHLVPVII